MRFLALSVLVAFAASPAVAEPRAVDFEQSVCRVYTPDHVLRGQFFVTAWGDVVAQTAPEIAQRLPPRLVKGRIHGLWNALSFSFYHFDHHDITEPRLATLYVYPCRGAFRQGCVKMAEYWLGGPLCATLTGQLQSRPFNAPPSLIDENEFHEQLAWMAAQHAGLVGVGPFDIGKIGDWILKFKEDRVR